MGTFYPGGINPPWTGNAWLLFLGKPELEMTYFCRLATYSVI